MKTVGDRVSGETWPFDFATLEPRPDAPRWLVVLLHGVGGDERQMAAMGAALPDDALVVLPRGQRSISGDRIGWFRESVAGAAPQVVEDEAEEARTRLVDFIGRLQQRFDVAPTHTVLAGFSQGGELAASAALTAADGIAGFAMLCGRILPEVAPGLAPRRTLRTLHALLVHGRGDETLAPAFAQDASKSLDALGIKHELHLHDAGHELTQAMEGEFVRWFGERARPWMDEPHRP